MNSFKHAIVTVSLIMATVSLSGGQIVEAVVARVGDRIITLSQYQTRLVKETEQIRAAFPPEVAEERIADLEGNLLDEMIRQLLLQDRADQLEITVTREELDAAIDSLQEQYGITTDEQFEASLRESGLTRLDMEERLRATLLQNKLFSLELRARSRLSDRELKKRYEQDRERYRLPERAKVRELVILKPENADEATRRALNQRAQEVYERALAGEDFAALVEEYSAAPSRERGGELGTVARGELLPVLDSGVFRSDAGAILGPIETRYGYHILSVDERLPSQVPAFDEIKERLREEQSSEAFQADLNAYLDRLREQTFVRINRDLIS